MNDRRDTLVSIPHEEIQSAEDRSWTERLLGWLVLPELPAAERDEIATTLERVEDPRAEARLTCIVEARELPEAAREAAGAILRSAGNPPGGARLRAIWAGGDALLRRHAMLLMGRAEADIVEPVARDPAHPLHKEAIEALAFDFSEPRFQALKIAALEHPDADVRKVAADALLWDEPVAAEAPLLRAAADPAVDVAIAALDTLHYYPTQRCLRAVAALCGHPDERVRAAAGRCAFEIREDRFRWALDRADPAERRRLLAWMDPVRHLLGIPEDDAVPRTDDPATHARIYPPGSDRGSDVDLETAELVALYADLDGCWADRKSRFSERFRAERYAADRGVLTAFLVGHPDPWIRERSAALLAAWGEHRALLGLTHDPAFHVKKSAMYWLGQLSANRALAAPAWEHLGELGTTGTHALETLNTYVAHARKEDSIPRLLTLARSDGREPVRCGAVDALAKLGARAEIEALLPLLAEPPQVTWGTHIALLRACRPLGLHPGRCDALRAVDNIDVQIALVRMMAA
ncbi:HEAT repeat domain-containing protein [Sorangium sp. So ce887]|uniref:HEAT repeat domain-containing protein n=1 Tax=Sorangium sp. So ce887 TaxID=3133324 RepID=UPI003F5D9FA3